MEGKLVSSEHLAETLAEYLEKVKWTDRPLEPILWHEHVGPDLPVKVDLITEEEVVTAAAKLKAGKATGSDSLPPDFWKHI